MSMPSLAGSVARGSPFGESPPRQGGPTEAELLKNNAAGIPARISTLLHTSRQSIDGWSLSQTALQRGRLNASEQITEV